MSLSASRGGHQSVQRHVASLQADMQCKWAVITAGKAGAAAADKQALKINSNTLWLSFHMTT